MYEVQVYDAGRDLITVIKGFAFQSAAIGRGHKIFEALGGSARTRVYEDGTSDVRMECNSLDILCVISEERM